MRRPKNKRARWRRFDTSRKRRIMDAWLFANFARIVMGGAEVRAEWEAKKREVRP